MNDRIKELMAESGISYKPMVIDGEEYEYRHVEFDDWKFEDEADCLENLIKSIILECAELVEYNSKGAGRDIREHFGVQNETETL